jgi:TetR/AcrR family transcriptional repressor of mexJK operon
MSATADLLPETMNPKRRAILVAAAELFMADGYAAVSMDGVARAAGVSKATLYAHFTGKEALFGAIVADGCAVMRQQADSFLKRRDLPLQEALVELGMHWQRFMLRPQVRSLHRVMIAEGMRFPALAQGFYDAGPQAMETWLTDWIRGEQARGRILANVSPDRAAEKFLSLLRGNLFLRATLGLVHGETPTAELAAIALDAAVSFIRLHGATIAEQPADGFA